jgi:biopolymer transport protein TolQ
MNLFTSGDLAITGSSILLVIGSVLSWYVIIGKIRLWHRAGRMSINQNLPIDDVMRPFDQNLWFLSMTSTVAPFVGLFGTVWGVMNAFASIGTAQSVALAVIAPGLAAALGTTVLGLMVAIPAAIAHQYFSKKSDDLYNRLANDNS